MVFRLIAYISILGFRAKVQISGHVLSYDKKKLLMRVRVCRRHSFDCERTSAGAMRAVFIAAFVSIAAVSARKEGEDIVVRPSPDTVHFGGYEFRPPTLRAICPI